MYTHSLLGLPLLLYKFGNSEFTCELTKLPTQHSTVREKFYIFNHVFDRFIVETYMASTETSIQKVISKGYRFHTQHQTVF